MNFCQRCKKEIDDNRAVCEECLEWMKQENITELPKVLRPTADSRDIKLAALLILPCLLLINCLFWSNVGLGVTIGFLLIGIITFWYISKSKQKPSVYRFICTIFFILMAVTLSLSDHSLTKGLSVVVILLLYLIIITDHFDLRSHKSGSYSAILDILRTAFDFGLGNITNGIYALLHKNHADGEVTKRRIGHVFSGIALAIPVLLIVVPLLISSDAAFESIFKDISLSKIFEIVITLLCGGLYFLSVFSRLFMVKNAEVKPAAKSSFKGITAISVYSFLVAVSSAYVLYLFSQLAYFFNAFAGLLPKDFTMAEYARRGFFEMSAVCGINLLIILLTTVLCRKEGNILPKPLKALNGFLCCFSLLLIITAISKMVLYIDRFGMTRLRIYTSLFMVFLGLVFVTVILKLFIRKLPYMKIILITACSVLLLSCLFDADRIIANYNVNAYLNDKLQNVDVSTLEDLDSSAIDPLLKLYHHTEGELHTEVKHALNRRFKAHFNIIKIIKDETGIYIIEGSDFDIRGFNVTEYLALKSLREGWTEFFDWELYNGQEADYDLPDPNKQ